MREEIPSYPGVVQLGRTLDLGSRGREFESRHSDQPGKVMHFIDTHSKIRVILNLRVRVPPHAPQTAYVVQWVEHKNNVSSFLS